MLEPELLKHGGPVFGRPFLAVERDDAPGDQVISREKLLDHLRVGLRGGALACLLRLCDARPGTDDRQQCPNKKQRRRSAEDRASGAPVECHDVVLWMS